MNFSDTGRTASRWMSAVFRASLIRVSSSDTPLPRPRLGIDVISLDCAVVAPRAGLVGMDFVVALRWSKRPTRCPFKNERREDWVARPFRLLLAGGSLVLSLTKTVLEQMIVNTLPKQLLEKADCTHVLDCFFCACC